VETGNRGIEVNQIDRSLEAWQLPKQDIISVTDRISVRGNLVILI
jgi:hypothetical protein